MKDRKRKTERKKKEKIIINKGNQSNILSIKNWCCGCEKKLPNEQGKKKKKDRNK
jgi:hypothetical protein